MTSARPPSAHYLDPRRRAGLCEVTPLRPDQFLTVNTELEPAAAAADYAARLAAVTGLRLDLLLLGAGPDGHPCSLFPGHALLQEPGPGEGGRVVAHITDSPKPPPCRVTLTLPVTCRSYSNSNKVESSQVVNSASCCVFAAVGESKAAMMKRLLADKEPLPAALVRPSQGEVVWVLDSGAHSGLA